MSHSEPANTGRFDPSGAAPGWWVVCSSEFSNWLTSLLLFTVLVFHLLFLYASPRLGLDAGRARRILKKH